MADPTDSEMLSAIRSALKGTLDSNAQSYSIGGRSLTHVSIPDLITLESLYSRRVSIANGTNRPGVVTFGNPT